MAETKQLAEQRFPACSKNLRNVRTLVRHTLRELGCSPEFVDTTVSAVDEATCNVMRHAYGGDNAGDIILQIQRQGETLVFRLIDFAPPVISQNVKSRDLNDLRPGGLGVFLVAKFMDTMQFETPPEGAGNMLVMTRKRDCE